MPEAHTTSIASAITDQDQGIRPHFQRAQLLLPASLYIYAYAVSHAFKMPSLNPPKVTDCDVTFPEQYVMLVTINRPKKMNSIPPDAHSQLERLFEWYDAEPSLRASIITGTGQKAFCAGSDLIEIEAAREAKLSNTTSAKDNKLPRGGFAGLSRRKGKKPVIAAVNGLAFGGGFEIVLNCDIAISSPKALFALPEAIVGVYAWGGGLPRLVHSAGLAAASDIALTGRRVPAQEALQLGLISRVSKSPESVLPDSIEVAKQIASISPDGIIVTRAGLREAWENGNIEEAFHKVHAQYYDGLMRSDNSKEGLAAFREKRKPKWVDAKL